MHILQDLLPFFENSPTPWHAAKEISNRLALADFEPLEESSSWQLKSGENYFIHAGGLAFAFILPKKAVQKLSIVAAHSDSPALKLKPKGKKSEHNLLTHGIEVYGSPILPSWFGKDLVIAGRVAIQTADKQIETHLVQFDDALTTIANLALHLDRDANKSFKINREKHLRPILGLASEADSDAYLQKLFKAQFPHQKVLSFDLFLVPIDPPRLLGASQELLSSYRIDNLSSCYAALYGITQTNSSESTMQCALFWNHEEIGSFTKEGADSGWFENILRRIAHHLKLNEEELQKIRSQSFCLSMDSAHGIHPNYLDRYDLDNSPEMGKGIVIKRNASEKYATNVESEAIVKSICETHKIPYQFFAIHGQQTCGSTIGPIFSTKSAILSADVGASQLAMHSCRELMALSDLFDLCRLAKGALNF